MRAKSGFDYSAILGTFLREPEEPEEDENIAKGKLRRLTTSDAKIRAIKCLKVCEALNLDFEWRISNHTATAIEITTEFKQKKFVSAKAKDYIVIKVMDSGFFRSAESDKVAISVPNSLDKDRLPLY